MKISLIPNYQNNRIMQAANSIVGLLISHGHEVFVHKKIHDKIPLASPLSSHADFSKNSDFFIALGGDGTIIHAAKHAGSVPVLGINMGRLGYLAAIEYNEIDEIIPILNGNYSCEDRMMIEISKEGCVLGHALNDGVISSHLSKLLDFEVVIDKSTFHYRADGLILSTPTGSTAYSLSAGGPVVDSGISCMVFTPICPHSLFNRSIVLSPTAQLRVKVLPRFDEKVILTIDGEKPFPIESGEEVCFTAAKKKVRLIMKNPGNFFERVNKKLLSSEV